MPKTHNNEEKQVEDNYDINNEKYDDDYDILIKKMAKLMRIKMMIMMVIVVIIRW